MPPALAAIQAGRPLAASTGVPGLRLAGVQAQANETPVERAARMESYELAGARAEDITAAEERIRARTGTGVKAGVYRGAPGRGFGRRA